MLLQREKSEAKFYLWDDSERVRKAKDKVELQVISEKNSDISYEDSPEGEKPKSNTDKWCILCVNLQLEKYHIFLGGVVISCWEPGSWVIDCFDVGTVLGDLLPFEDCPLDSTPGSENGSNYSILSLNGLRISNNSMKLSLFEGKLSRQEVTVW